MEYRKNLVALLAEGVDRNSAVSHRSYCLLMVALLAEGVDRNTTTADYYTAHSAVALLAEGVDRNFRFVPEGSGWPRRPPRGGRG